MMDLSGSNLIIKPGASGHDQFPAEFKHLLFS